MWGGLRLGIAPQAPKSIVVTDNNLAMDAREILCGKAYAEIRDGAELAKLPADLQAECRTFWADVTALIRELE